MEGGSFSSEGVRMELTGNDTPGTILRSTRAIEDHTVSALDGGYTVSRDKGSEFIATSMER